MTKQISFVIIVYSTRFKDKNRLQLMQSNIRDMNVNLYEYNNY